MFESVLELMVSQLLSTAVDKWRKSRMRDYPDFDFVFEDKAGEKVAIEILGKPPHERKLASLSALMDRGPEINRFVLVTSEPPTKEQNKLFKSVLADSRAPVSWIDINELPSLLGIEAPGDLRTPQGMAALQLAALISNKQQYITAPIGADIEKRLPKEVPEEKADEEPPPEYMALRRQFPFETITLLHNEKRDLEQSLCLGDRVKDVTVVLSDIKNFSSMVKAARAEDLRDIMSKYYFKARDLVWTNGGVLDKFIGDAVLAIFGYPLTSQSAAERAIRFSQELVSLGVGLLGGLSRELNEVIPTGTRVGIATGDIWPLDIGERQLEVSFVGDVINLAARLEKNSLVDAVLLCHRTKIRALASNGSFVDSLALEERQLEPSDAKGQMFPIRCWQIPPLKGDK